MEAIGREKVKPRERPTRTGTTLGRLGAVALTEWPAMAWLYNETRDFRFR